MYRLRVLRLAISTLYNIFLFPRPGLGNKKLWDNGGMVATLEGIIAEKIGSQAVVAIGGVG